MRVSNPTFEQNALEPKWWKIKVAHPVGQVDDYVKHVFREHNQEADHLANLGAEDQGKVSVETQDDTENWKGVR